MTPTSSPTLAIIGIGLMPHDPRPSHVETLLNDVVQALPKPLRPKLNTLKIAFDHPQTHSNCIFYTTGGTIAKLPSNPTAKELMVFCHTLVGSMLLRTNHQLHNELLTKVDAVYKDHGGMIVADIIATAHLGPASALALITQMKKTKEPNLSLRGRVCAYTLAQLPMNKAQFWSDKVIALLADTDPPHDAELRSTVVAIAYSPLTSCDNNPLFSLRAWNDDDQNFTCFSIKSKIQTMYTLAANVLEEHRPGRYQQ